MAKGTTIVLGAGVAGLSAALELAEAGESVQVLEARQRLGGRIHTVKGGLGPVELGAEFVHGRAPRLLDLLRSAELPAREVVNRHRIRRGAHLEEADPFEEAYSRKLETAKAGGPDLTFTQFIDGDPDYPPGWKQFALDLVEGFDAAEASRVSVASLVKERESSEAIDGDTNLRVAGGYAGLIDWLERQLRRREVAVHRGVVAGTIGWEQGAVAIRDTAGRSYDASRVIITLPLGVLKSGAVDIVPEIPAKMDDIRSLEMGQVTKIHLEFSSRLWPEENFGFLHQSDEWFPTWWSHEQGPLLTGWAGGSRAIRMATLGQDEVLGHALGAMSHLFSLGTEAFKDALTGVFFHDWFADPFARGAYSYIPAGALPVQQRLAEPIGGTLYFAGEATALDGQLGTVHGAIGSARRVVQQVLKG